MKDAVQLPLNRNTSDLLLVMDEGEVFGTISQFSICDMTREDIQSFEFAPCEFNHVIQDNNFNKEFIPSEFLNYF